ncbi:hypothetical protein BHU24_26120 [Bacillus pseudomycoides]|nr:hypothetical protein [Bacillus pseudomycoides]
MVEVVETSRQDSVGITVSFALTLNQIAIILAPACFWLHSGYQRVYVGVGVYGYIAVCFSNKFIEKLQKKSHTNDIFLQYDV